MHLNPTLQKWIPLALVTTVLCGLSYLTLQQFIRLSADEVPADITSQALLALKKGTPPASMLPPAAAEEMKGNSSPFVMIFDDKGVLAASTTKINGKDPSLPSGVFEAARKYGENRITWQPEKGLRNAIIVTHYSGTQPGFVVVGKSLQIPESHISRLGQQVFGGWIVALALAYGAILVLEKQSRHKVA